MKTKSFILLLLFSSLTTIMFAQLSEKQAQKYKWSISAAINSVEAQLDQKLLDTWVYPSANYYSYFGNKHDNSLSLSIIPKYHITGDILLRFELGITNIDLQSYYNGINDSNSNSAAANIIKTDTIRQKIYRFIAGVQWDFIQKKFIESYCGASLCYLKYNEMYWTDFIIDNKYNQTGKNTATTAGGFATGIGAFVGVNIYLHKQISIGGEFSYSILYYKLGGMQNGIYQRTTKNVMDVKENWAISDNTSTGIQFSKVIPSFNLTVYF
jgi:type II secretory pathway pseudopilin PulG